MFSNKVAGKYISRIVCMIMFVLIQFDVFGYDLIYAAYCDDTNSIVLSLDDESSINDSHDQYSEWSDPVYRTSSVRFFPDSVDSLFVIPDYSFEQYGVYIQPYVSKLPIYITDCHPYIMFRALLI
ncbi:hypothetical protein [Bacteroides caecigallinarum]|uniref:hypothetical protein n=1 Tax=Bacteroides caecigallinarum TaxID=1411144 RepID=UPI001F3DE0F8|nr:hypothetical protein [Bacteroides caecigallinarum]MCF2583113.1 hypothetical protein [Bacteroides caecigallinarum]